MSWSTELEKCLRKPWRDRLLALEAVFWLGLSRVAIATLPFRWCASLLGLRAGQGPLTHPESSRGAPQQAWCSGARPPHPEQLPAPGGPPGPASRLESREAQPEPAAAPAARRIKWAVDAASRRTPWRNVCLGQALTAVAMLRLRQLPAALYLGVGRGLEGEPAPVPEPKSLSAHAWVSSGELIVTGAPGHERFTVVGRFS